VWEGGSAGLRSILDQAAAGFEPGCGQFGPGLDRFGPRRGRWKGDRGRSALDGSRVLQVEGMREGGAELAYRFEYFK
jgi:hypothetical protein